MSDADIAALTQGTPAKGLTHEEEVARRFTATLVAKHRIDDALFEEARQIFHDRGLVDLIILAGSYQLVSSLLNAFEVPVPA